MNSSNLLQKFESNYDHVAHIAHSMTRAFHPEAHLIPRFLQEYNETCLNNMNELDSDSRFAILTNLRDLCIEILKSYPTQIDSTGTLKNFFKMAVNQEVTTLSINFTEIIKSVRNLNKVRDVTEIGEAICFYYYTILEYFLITSNNLVYTCLESQNFELALDLLLKTTQCWRSMEYSSYNIKYQVSTVLVNLASVVEEDYKLEASQLLCNVALHLEDLEVEIDRDPENVQIYEHLSERASQFLFLLRPKNDSQSIIQPGSRYNKSFLLARMCMIYAYYADILLHLGKQKESEIARKHASILKAELERRENPSPQKQRSPDSSKQAKNGFLNKSSSSNSKYASTPATAMTSTSSSNFSTGSKLQGEVCKENIIFQKHVEINETRYRVIIVNQPEIECVQVVAYDKPRNKLSKLFIHFKDVLELAHQYDADITIEKEMTKLLSKLAKLLYFKESILQIKDLPFYKNIEELKFSPLL